MIYKCIALLMEKAKQVGAEIDGYSLRNGGMIILDAPKGYVWRANGNTSISEIYEVRGHTWLTQACRFIERSASMGLDKVTSPEELQRIRHARDDDSWAAPADAPEKLVWPKNTKRK